MKKNSSSDSDFHAVDFMRQVRTELTSQFQLDRKKYLDYLKESMEKFKKRKASCTHHSL